MPIKHLDWIGSVQFQTRYLYPFLNLIRLQRSLDTKDNYLKDLKAKIAALEDKDKDKDGAGGSSSSDLAALSAAELRTRFNIYLIYTHTLPACIIYVLF